MYNFEKSLFNSEYMYKRSPCRLERSLMNIHKVVTNEYVDSYTIGYCYH